MQSCVYQMNCYGTPVTREAHDTALGWVIWKDLVRLRSSLWTLKWLVSYVLGSVSWWCGGNYNADSFSNLWYAGDGWKSNALDCFCFFQCFMVYMVNTRWATILCAPTNYATGQDYIMLLIINSNSVSFLLVSMFISLLSHKTLLTLFCSMQI